MTTNIGYDVLVSCNEQLVTHFASDPGGNAGVMFQNHLISEGTNQKINQLDKTNTDKARMLVVELQARVKSFPGTYDEFITILRERNERHDDLLLSVLTDKYKELEAVTDTHQTVDAANSAETEVPVEPQRIVATNYEGQAGGEKTPRSISTSSSGIESLTTSDSLTFFNFQCGCGECTILGHVTGKDKCLSSKPPQIKRYTRDTACNINTVSPTEISESFFMKALDIETRKIQSKFCSLLTNTIMNLEKQEQYDVTQLKQHVQKLLTPQGSYFRQIYHSPSEQISLCDTISFNDLIEFLQNNFCSWFNYSLIFEIREEFLFSHDDDQALHKYERLFQKYVNRRCFLFVDDFGPEPSHIESVEITCKIDVDFDAITYDQIQELKLVFMKCWEQLLPHQVLNLKHVREGCTELVFRVPAYFSHVYSQLSPEQMQHLKENAFIEVKIGQQVILKAKSNSTKKLLKAFGQDGGDPTSALASLIGLDPTVDVSSISDSDGMTLLHLACRWDWSKWGLLVTQLVETHHHNVSVVNEDGDTPLHTAARFNNKGAAEYLLELSDVNARNNVGLTPFDIAYQKQHQEVLRVLVECDEIFANIPIIRVPIISTHDVSQSDEPIHGTSSDSLPMSPYKDESTSPQGNNLNSVSDVSTTREDLSIISTLSHQSRAERYGSTIRSRNFRSDDSEPNQPLSVLKSEPDDDDDETTEHSNPPEYSESTRPSTIPTYLESNENCPPRCNLPYNHPPAYSNQQPPPSQQDSEASNDLHMQPHDSDSQTTLIINDSQPHEEHQNTISSIAKALCTGCLSIVDNHWGKALYKVLFSEESSQRSSRFLSRFSFFLGIIFFATYFSSLIIVTNPRVHEGSVHIAQLIQPSILPIALIGPNVLQLTLTEIPNTQIIPIYFNISNCDDIRKENTTIYEEGILTPEENTPIYELYTQYNVSLRLQIQLLADYNSSDQECPVVLVVFNDVREYESFLHNGSWTFTYMEYCIKNDNFSISIILAANSYYFFGVHFEANSHIISNITYRINGWKEENSTSSFTSHCSITSTATTAACNYNFDSFVNTLELCIVGVVPKRNASDVVRKAELQYSYSTFSSINVLVAWLILIMFFLVWLLPPICKKWITFRICHSRQSHHRFCNSLSTFIILFICLIIVYSFFIFIYIFYTEFGV